MIRFHELKRIHVELSSACNAACPSCPRNVDGGYTVPELVPTTMSLSDFQTIFTRDVLQQINDILMCGNYGDPVFCKDLPDIVEYINQVNPNLRINVHTNGGIRSTTWWSRLATLKNLHVVFSIDGLADTNHIYRRHVNWDRLQENFHAFISSGGYAIWEFLIFKHNEHQLDQAQMMAKDFGFAEIRFKRAFGFDSSQGSHESMRVLDEHGEYSYSIYPPTDENMANRVNSENLIHRYSHGQGYPRDAYIRNWQVKNENYDDLYTKEAENYQHLDGTEISCMTKNSGEIYIDSRGYLHPCCFLGIGGYNVTVAYDSLQYYRWLQQNAMREENNCMKHQIRDILNSTYLDGIEKTWNLTHNQGRMFTCSKMCSKKYSPRERLYVRN